MTALRHVGYLGSIKTFFSILFWKLYDAGFYTGAYQSSQVNLCVCQAGARPASPTHALSCSSRPCVRGLFFTLRTASGSPSKSIDFTCRSVSRICLCVSAQHLHWRVWAAVCLSLGLIYIVSRSVGMKNSMGGGNQKHKDQFEGCAALQGWMRNIWMGCWERRRMGGLGNVLRLRCWPGMRPGHEEIMSNPEANGLTNVKRALSPLR